MNQLRHETRILKWKKLGDDLFLCCLPIIAVGVINFMAHGMAFAAQCQVGRCLTAPAFAASQSDQQAVPPLRASIRIAGDVQ